MTIRDRLLKELEAEIVPLQRELKVDIPRQLAEAAAHGDLSENAEYDAAKDKQGFIEGRILEIEGKLAAAQIIDPAMAKVNITGGASVAAGEAAAADES